MNTTGETSQNHGPGSKNQTESSIREIGDRDILEVGQVSQGRKDCESRNKTVDRVEGHNDTGVSKDGLVSLTMGPVGCQETKRQTVGKENLGTRLRPDLSLGAKNGKIPYTNESVDTIGGTR